MFPGPFFMQPPAFNKSSVIIEEVDDDVSSANTVHARQTHKSIDMEPQPTTCAATDTSTVTDCNEVD